MATRVGYPVEVKKKAIKMRLDGIPVKEIMEQLNIRNKTQVETWIRWYRSGQLNRLEQPVGKNNTATVKDLNIHPSWEMVRRKIGSCSNN